MRRTRRDLNNLPPIAGGAPTSQELRDEHARVLTQIDDILRTAREQNRTALTDDERTQHDQLVARANDLHTQVTAMLEVERAAAAGGTATAGTGTTTDTTSTATATATGTAAPNADDAARFAAFDQRQSAAGQAATDATRAAAGGAPVPALLPSAGVGGAVVTSEPRTYSPEAARQGRSFVADLYRAQFHFDPAAGQRIARHATEIARHGGPEAVRDLSTGAFGALIPPQYLLDEFAPLARAGRPFANALRTRPLPPVGMTMTVPRGTTGTTTGAQNGENTAISETDFAVTDLSFGVKTVAGEQDVSRQSLERGTSNDSLIFADLSDDYATQLDGQVLAGTGANGTHLGLLNVAGINAVTYTDATPTVAEFWPKLADAIGRINTNRKKPATAIVMHPRRWAWITAAVDGQGRPLFANLNPSPALLTPYAVGVAAEYGQVVGEMQGLPVITDANIPTNLGAGANEDIVVVARLGQAGDPLLMEENDGMPREVRFDQTKGTNLTIVLVVYGYSAFTGGRYPSAIATIGGTGLVTPTF